MLCLNCSVTLALFAMDVFLDATHFCWYITYSFAVNLQFICKGIWLVENRKVVLCHTLNCYCSWMWFPIHLLGNKLHKDWEKIWFLGEFCSHYFYSWDPAENYVHISPIEISWNCGYVMVIFPMDHPTGLISLKWFSWSEYIYFALTPLLWDPHEHWLGHHWQHNVGLFFMFYKWHHGLNCILVASCSQVVEAVCQHPQMSKLKLLLPCIM